jgi:hypothetical protein
VAQAAHRLPVAVRTTETTTPLTCLARALVLARQWFYCNDIWLKTERSSQGILPRAKATRGDRGSGWRRSFLTLFIDFAFGSLCGKKTGAGVESRVATACGAQAGSTMVAPVQTSGLLGHYGELGRCAEMRREERLGHTGEGMG